jgi:anti-sigma factor RsiW
MRARRPCRRYRQALVDVGERGPVNLGLRRHAKQCPRCQRELEQYRQMHRLMRSLAADVPIPGKRVRRLARSTRKFLFGGLAGSGISMLGLLIATNRKRR